MNSPVTRISWLDTSPDYIVSSLQGNNPIVFTDLTNDLQVLDWDLSRLSSQYGHILLKILRSPSNYFTYSDKTERDIVSMTLNDFLNKAVFQTSTDGYSYTLGRSPVGQFSGFHHQLDLPFPLSNFINSPFRFPERNIWISPHGTRTALHFDAVDNLNIQIQGSKSFLLFPPRIDSMYPYPLISQAAYVSQIDPRSARIPHDFPISDATEVILNSGEMLYLPYGWWHQVDTVGSHNLNANYWWFPRLKLVKYLPQTLRGAAVLIHRRGQHPHKRAQRLSHFKS